MKIYGTTVDKKGEKNFVETEGYKYITFKTDLIQTIMESSNEKDVEIRYELIETDGESYLRGIITENNSEVKYTTLINTADFVDAGADAYYNDKTIDEIELIKEAKNQIINQVKNSLFSKNIFVQGKFYDLTALMKKDNSVIGALDEINFLGKSLSYKKSYFAFDINENDIGEFTLEIHANGKVYNTAAQVDNDKIIIGTLTESQEKYIEFAKANDLTYEEYSDDRAKYITIDEEFEEMDDFDELF